MKTTINDLADMYDETVELLRERIRDKTATAADVTNLLRLLDKAALLESLKARPGSSPDALPVADLPFPLDDEFEMRELARTR